MKAALARDEIEAAYLAACLGELEALKPGNVSRHSAGHRMDVSHFERAAKASAPFIADPDLSVGKCILRATEASVAATGVNVNLGIVLLAAPLAKAASETTFDMGLRRRLTFILSMLDEADARDAFAAIRIANPAGLGKVEDGDVGNEAPRITLTLAMHLAQMRDRIANAYVTAYSDVFDFALPVLQDARAASDDPNLPVTTLHMALLAEFPDSHIARKHGPDVAAEVQRQAAARRSEWSPIATAQSLRTLAEFDADLKEKGLNPGTTADFVVATLLVERLLFKKV